MNNFEVASGTNCPVNNVAVHLVRRRSVQIAKTQVQLCSYAMEAYFHMEPPARSVVQRARCVRGAVAASDTTVVTNAPARESRVSDACADLVPDSLRTRYARFSICPAFP
ncbi:hypothetical protein J6590_014606 [Homalodisca vitripennis]|nr:hypothetical protein J6590_014606 [Homalodisca vitripennis]